MSRAAPDTTQPAFADRWTPVHAFSGVATGLGGMPTWTYLALGVGYEMIEYAVEEPRGSKIFGTKRPESGLNILGDLAFGVAGNLAGRALRQALRR